MLTYEHHCWAFRHAAKQDPAESSILEQTGISSACSAHMYLPPELPPTATPTLAFRLRRSLERVQSVLTSLASNLVSPFENRATGNPPEAGAGGDVSEDTGGDDVRPHSRFSGAEDNFIMQPTAGSIHKPGDNFGVIVSGKSTKTPLDTGRKSSPADKLNVKANEPHRSPTGSWHDKPQTANGTTKWVTCGNFSSAKDYSHVICTPRPNPFNPCEDVMGYEWLRVFVWLVLLAALGGNLVVMVVLLSARSKLTVPKFLMCNLSFADFLMGLYLLLIASVDVHFLGEYFTHAVSWQNDGGCQVAGFLTVFSSELSVFVLTVITLERWYAISQAIHVNKRLRMRQATCLMFAGWVYASSLAVLPLLGVSGYGAVSICLPMEAKDPLDIVYIILLLVFNGIAFTAICGCYISMFLKVRASENMARSNDATIAKRMAILVLTNFICWAPIAFFGLTASFGFPLIDITNSKVLLVFFYPFNSCANPFLYAILTKQFRKDVFILLGRYGLCTDRANRYKGTSVTRSYSYNSRHNNGLMVGGHHRHQPSASDVSILSQYCRTGSRGSRGSLFSQSGTGWGSSTPTRMSRTGSSKDSLSRSGLHRLSGSGTSSLLESNLDACSATNQSLPTGRSLKSIALAQSPLSGSPPSCSRSAFPASRASSPTNNSSSNGSEGRSSSKGERKLSTVLETSHASSEPLSDDGCCGGGLSLSGDGNTSHATGQSAGVQDKRQYRICLDEERVLQGRDSLRDLFEGQPYGRVRSASEYVVVFKSEEHGLPASASIGASWEKNASVDEQSQEQRRDSERRISRDTVLSSNTVSSLLSTGQGSASCSERRISRDTVLSSNTVSSLLSNNTVGSIARLPTPSFNKASDGEQLDTGDITRRTPAVCADKIQARPLCGRNAVETVASPRLEHDALSNQPKGKQPISKTATRPEEVSLLLYHSNDQMIPEQFSTTFTDIKHDGPINCQDGSKSEERKSQKNITIQKILQDSKTAKEKAALSSFLPHKPLIERNLPLGSFQQSYSRRDEDRHGSLKKIYKAPSISAEPPQRKPHHCCQFPRTEQKLNPDLSSQQRNTATSLRHQKDESSAASERDVLLRTTSRSTLVHNGTFDAWTGPEGAIVEEEEDEDDDEELEREVRVRERRKRRKRRKKLKNNNGTSSRVGVLEKVCSGAGGESRHSPEVNTDQEDYDKELDFLESLLQSV
ncbi:thyrotropin receptor [Elysia marginata]|uniref:Thyrotropin receptor n=1 Tax=Elysia marginata TaxID=1093978 RepID=A0AAV4EHH5_9GAST|nr:thyrotropin receptor [Elysia marginata]